MSRKIDEAFIAEIQLTVEAYKRLHNCAKVAKLLNVNASTISRRLDMAHKYGINVETDREIVVETVKLAKQKQGLQDVQRIERKSFRESARIENAVEALNVEIVNILGSTKFNAPKASYSHFNGKACLILHISDNHLNEQVDLPHNQFNWNIAGQRLKKLADRAIQIGNAYGIKNLFIAFTGDLLNSDRRLDEMLSNATNRASACILAVYMYGQMLQHLASHFKVSVASISGNESRIQKDVGWAKEVASDNYDALIFNILRMQHSHYIDFSHSTEPSEQVVMVAGQNVLLIHGHGAKGTGQINIQAVKGKYLARGIVIDFVISGHYHETHIADFYARSASLVGSNAYSEDALNMSGRASQNLYIVHEGGGFDGLKVDLQHTDDVEGYDIQEHLVTYNTKSAKKCHNSQTIFSVVI